MGFLAPPSWTDPNRKLHLGVRSGQRCSMPILVVLGSSVWELCGAQILGFAFKTYPALPIQPCWHVIRWVQRCLMVFNAWLPIKFGVLARKMSFFTPYFIVAESIGKIELTSHLLLEPPYQWNLVHRLRKTCRVQKTQNRKCAAIFKDSRSFDFDWIWYTD
jgi:hypothetical protein